MATAFREDFEIPRKAEPYKLSQKSKAPTRPRCQNSFFYTTGIGWLALRRRWNLYSAPENLILGDIRIALAHCIGKIRYCSVVAFGFLYPWQRIEPSSKETRISSEIYLIGPTLGRSRTYIHKALNR